MALTELTTSADELELVSFDHVVLTVRVVAVNALVAEADAEKFADDVALVVICTGCSVWT